MKYSKFYVVFLFISLAGFFLFSCQKETTDVDPTITLDGSSSTYTAEDATLAEGATLTIKGVAAKGNNGAKLAYFQFRQGTSSSSLNFVTGGGTFNGTTITSTTFSGSDNKGYEISSSSNESFNFTIVISSLSFGSSSSLIFEIDVVDKDGKEATQMLTITKASVKTFSSVTFSNENAFFSTSSSAGTTVPYNNTNATANASTIDLTYFWSSTSGSGNNMASPAARTNSSIYGSYAITWGTVATEFKTTTLSATDFDNLSDPAALATAFSSGTSTTVPNNTAGTRFNENDGTYAVGKVIAFKGYAGKYGLIKIKSLSSSTSGSSAVDIKVQQ